MSCPKYINGNNITHLPLIPLTDIPCVISIVKTLYLITGDKAFQFFHVYVKKMKSPNLSKLVLTYIQTHSFNRSAANIPVQTNHIHFDVIILYFI